MLSNQRPSLLPDKPTPPPTTPTQQQRRQKAQRRYLLMIITILIILLLGLLLSIVIRPDLFGLMQISDFEQTNQSYSLTEQAQNSTQQALVTANAQLLNQQQNLQSTQVELNNRQYLIESTETQQAVNMSITQTAIAVDNAAEATQAVVDFQQTQQALQQQATQVQQQFDATQTALNDNVPTAIPTVPPNVAFIDGGIVNLSESLPSNNLPLTQAWSMGQDGALIAQQNNATLITRQTEFGNQYTITAQFIPVTSSTFYDVFFGVSQDSGYGFRVFYDGSRITTIGLYRVKLQDIADGIIITPENTISSIANINQVANEILVTVFVDGNMIITTANETSLTQSVNTVPIHGHIGLQATTGTSLNRFTVNN